MFSLLLNLGFNPQKPNRNGQTPLQLLLAVAPHQSETITIVEPVIDTPHAHPAAGTTQSFEELLAAAGQGEPNAQFNVAECYDQAIGGVKEDLDEAAKWYRRAAKQGPCSCSAHAWWLLWQRQRSEPRLP